MMATACTGFTSCGDDNDEPEAPLLGEALT